MDGDEGCPAVTSLGPNALGVIRRAVSGEGEQPDEGAIRELAAARGYFVAEVVVFATAVRTAALLTVEHIRVVDAAAVIVPSLVHAHPFARAVTELCDLITPEQMYPRGYRWPSLLPIDHLYRRLP
ncbi:hypothetical protein OHA40_06885 [Nocardia sp. NBC_00508]|uniref:hypothetical protein n=1 Tax=Nocardia sp. NBC_00508 TaxID=2975992 RepID=UPI002E8225A6|nr:hypothetical protein [Nocardia sp. NBC_00508]WUD67846.1 hypothetical protein OHA40_06885 [Nocardia sp. NBC_00508]